MRIAHGPYLQQVGEEGFTVVWTTTTDAAVWVEVAPDDGSHFYAAERPKYYDTYLGKRRIGQLHRVRIEGLRPGTTYRYRIMRKPSWPTKATAASSSARAMAATCSSTAPSGPRPSTRRKPASSAGW